MNKTLLSLFEQNEQDFRDELSRISLPKDSEKLQDFMNDFFVNKLIQGCFSAMPECCMP